MRAEMLSDRLLDAERQRDDIVQRLDSHRRAAARAEKDWELERNNLHVSLPLAGHAALSSRLCCKAHASRPSQLAVCCLMLKRLRKGWLSLAFSALVAGISAHHMAICTQTALQAEVQRLSRKVAAAESAAAAAAAAAADSRQAAAAAESELAALRGAAARVEGELRSQLADSRAARDAEVIWRRCVCSKVVSVNCEKKDVDDGCCRKSFSLECLFVCGCQVSGLASKLEQALAACDKAVGDAQEVIAGKEALLAEWKKEAQLVSLFVLEPWDPRPEEAVSGQGAAVWQLRLSLLASVSRKRPPLRGRELFCLHTLIHTAQRVDSSTLAPVLLLLLLVQVSSKLESVLQQQSSEREEQQEQLQALSQQLADTQDHVLQLQQVGWESTRPCCCSGWFITG
jgi:hypothetical protein